MALPGRKPTPTELRLIRGNPGKRAIKPALKFEPLTERPPDELGPLGRNLWRRLSQQFRAAKLLQVTDREALIVLCDLWETYCQNMALVRKHGTLIRAGHNNSARASLVINPAWRVAKEAARQMEGMWASFGLTPSDRARLTMGGDRGEAPDDLLT